MRRGRGRPPGGCGGRGDRGRGRACRRSRPGVPAAAGRAGRPARQPDAGRRAAGLPVRPRGHRQPVLVRAGRHRPAAAHRSRRRLRAPGQHRRPTDRATLRGRHLAAGRAGRRRAAAGRDRPRLGPGRPGAPADLRRRPRRLAVLRRDRPGQRGRGPRHRALADPPRRPGAGAVGHPRRPGPAAHGAGHATAQVVWVTDADGPDALEIGTRAARRRAAAPPRRLAAGADRPGGRAWPPRRTAARSRWRRSTGTCAWSTSPRVRSPSWPAPTTARSPAWPGPRTRPGWPGRSPASRPLQPPAAGAGRRRRRSPTSPTAGSPTPSRPSRSTASTWPSCPSAASTRSTTRTSSTSRSRSAPGPTWCRWPRRRCRRSARSRAAGAIGGRRRRVRRRRGQRSRAMAVTPRSGGQGGRRDAAEEDRQAEGGKGRKAPAAGRRGPRRHRPSGSWRCRCPSPGTPRCRRSRAAWPGCCTRSPARSGEGGARPGDARPRPALQRFDLRRQPSPCWSTTSTGSWPAATAPGWSSATTTSLAVIPADRKGDSDSPEDRVEHRRLAGPVPGRPGRAVAARAGGGRPAHRGTTSGSPDLAGVDWDAVLAQYRPLLDLVATPSEFADVMWETLGRAGHLPRLRPPERGRRERYAASYPIGLLGADLERGPDGSWLIRRVVPGESSDPRARSPLSAPGVQVRPGDRLLAVDGRPVTDDGPGPLLAGRGGQAGRAHRGQPGHRRRPARSWWCRWPTRRRLRYQDWVASRRAAGPGAQRRPDRLPARARHGRARAGPTSTATCAPR